MVYRNDKYLTWVRTKNCLVSGRGAEVAHHVRWKDNTSGIGLRPSDYRVIPLLHCYHTTGQDAVHRIGAASFYKKFNINESEEIIRLLLSYLKEMYQRVPRIPEKVEGKDLISFLEREIELLRPLQEREQEISKRKKRKEREKKLREGLTQKLRESEEFRKREEKIREERNARMREIAKCEYQRKKDLMEKYQDESVIKYSERAKEIAREQRRKSYLKMKLAKKALKEARKEETH